MDIWMSMKSQDWLSQGKKNKKFLNLKMNKIFWNIKYDLEKNEEF